MSATAETESEKCCENLDAATPSASANQDQSEPRVIMISKFRQRYQQAKLRDEVSKALLKIDEPSLQPPSLTPLSPLPIPAFCSDQPDLNETFLPADTQCGKHVDEQENLEDDSPPAEFSVQSVGYVSGTNSIAVANVQETTPGLILSRFVTDVYSNFMTHKLETLDIKSPPVDLYSSWEYSFKSILNVDPNSVKPETRNQFRLVGVMLNRRLQMAQRTVELLLLQTETSPVEPESYEDRLGNIFELPSNPQDELPEELMDSMKNVFERCKEEYRQLYRTCSAMETSAADTVVAHIVENCSHELKTVVNQWPLQPKELETLSDNASTKIPEIFQSTWKPDLLTKYQEILKVRVSKAMADVAFLNETRNSILSILQEHTADSVQVYHNHMKELIQTVPKTLRKIDEFHNTAHLKAIDHFQTSLNRHCAATGPQSDENFVLTFRNQLELQLREARCSALESLLTEALIRFEEERAKEMENAEKFKAEAEKAMEQAVTSRVQVESDRITAEKSSELQKELTAARIIMKEELNTKIDNLSEQELYCKLVEKYRRRITEQFDAKIQETVSAHKKASSDKIKAFKSQMQKIIHERMAIVYEGMILSLSAGDKLVQELQSKVQSAETRDMIETELTVSEVMLKQELQNTLQASLSEPMRQLYEHAEGSNMTASIIMTTAHDNFEKELDRIVLKFRATTQKRQVNMLKMFEAQIDHKIQELLEPSEAINDTTPRNIEVPPGPELPTCRAPQRRLSGDELAFHVGLNGTTVGYLDPSTGAFKIIAAVKNCLYLENNTITIPFDNDHEAKLGKPALDFKRLILENPADTKYTISNQSCSWEARLEEILARFFLALKNKAEGDLKVKFPKCVLAVSQCLNNSQRTAIADGATIAGFQTVKLMNYTDAIALAYLMEADEPTENLLVVYPKTDGADVARFVIRHGQLQRRCGGRATEFLCSLLAAPVLESMGRTSAMLGLTDWLIRTKSSSTTYLLVGTNGPALDVMTRRLKTIFRASPEQIRKSGAEAVLTGAGYLCGLRSDASPNYTKVLWFAKLPLENKSNAERMLRTMTKNLVSRDQPATTASSNNVDGTNMTREEVMRKRNELHSQQDKLRLPST